MVDIEVRASPPNGTGGKHTEWITRIHLALWKKTHVTCFGWLNMFKQSHRTILDKITFLYFSILILQMVISSVVHLQISVRLRDFLDIFFTCRTVFLSPQIQIILHIHRERANRMCEKNSVFELLTNPIYFLRKSRKMRSHEKITWHYFSIIWARVFWISSGETKFQGDRPDS